MYILAHNLVANSLTCLQLLQALMQTLIISYADQEEIVVGSYDLYGILNGERKRIKTSLPFYNERFELCDRT